VKRPPASRADPRKGRRKRYSVNRKRLALSFLLLLLVGEFVFAALTSPVFSIKRVKVMGNRMVPASEVVRRLNLPANTCIFRIDKQAMAGRVCENPVIKRVTLHRALPRTLVVRVTERRPDFLLKTSAGVYEVDSSSVPFRLVDKVDARLPVIECGLPRRPVLGRKLTGSTLNSARKCLLLAREKKSLRVAKITVDQNNDLCLNVRDGFEVRLGRPEQLSKKLDIAAQSVEQIPELRQRGEYLDVTCPDAPAMKVRD